MPHKCYEVEVFRLQDDTLLTLDMVVALPAYGYLHTMLIFHCYKKSFTSFHYNNNNTNNKHPHQTYYIFILSSLAVCACEK